MISIYNVYFQDLLNTSNKLCFRKIVAQEKKSTIFYKLFQNNDLDKFEDKPFDGSELVTGFESIVANILRSDIPDYFKTTPIGWKSDMPTTRIRTIAELQIDYALNETQQKLFANIFNNGYEQLTKLPTPTVINSIGDNAALITVLNGR